MKLPDITPKLFFSTENHEWLESLLPWNEETFKPISEDEARALVALEFEKDE